MPAPQSLALVCLQPRLRLGPVMGLGAGGRACVLPEAPGLRLCVLDLFTRWGTSSGAGSFDFLSWGRLVGLGVGGSALGHP